VLVTRQGNFITSFFPENLEAGKDYDFFYLPPIDPAYGKPVLELAISTLCSTIALRHALSSSTSQWANQLRVGDRRWSHFTSQRL
jgi:hypothetical protein